MNQIPTESPSASAPPRGKSWLRAGTLLWVVVLASALGMYFKTRPAPEKQDAPPAAIVVDPEKAAAAKTPWNPNGIEDFALTERSGKTITKKDLLGHDWIVGFVFTSCLGPCPKVSKEMHDLQNELKGTDVRLLTITVDPKTDTPEKLQKYAEVFSADPEKWLFLTGDPEKVYKLIQGSFQAYVEEATGANRKPGFEVAHETNLLHLNSKGVVVAKYKALDGGEMAKLRKDLKATQESKAK
jgi:protein SCO1